MGTVTENRKKHIFRENLKNCSIFFLVVSRPLRRVFKKFSEKNSKKIKKFKFVKNFAQLFFSAIFLIFFSKKVNFSKVIQYFFLVVSRPLRKIFKTFSEKNSKKIKIFKF